MAEFNLGPSYFQLYLAPSNISLFITFFNDLNDGWGLEFPVLVGVDSFPIELIFTISSFEGFCLTALNLGF